MSGNLSPVGGNPVVNPNVTSQIEQLGNNLGISAKAKEVVQNVALILSGNGINITNMVSRTDENGKPTGATNTPVLDNPADLKALEANLEKLLAYLQLDNEERQAEMAKERIDIQKDTLATEHKDRAAKIKESLEKMDEAEKSRLANRIFGWIGAILAVAAAVVATVVTGGAAAGFAIAGAAIAVTSLILNETGAMDKMVEGLAKALEKAGMSKTSAQITAALLINIAIMAASVGCSIGGMATGFAQMASTVSKVISETAKAIQTATSISNTAVGLGGLAAGIANTCVSYNADMSQVDVTELAKIMAELQRRLDESQEELEAILQAIQNSLGQIAELLASETDTQTEIANQIGQMA